MTTCKRGDLILVAFVFADEKGVKKRPALVISSKPMVNNPSPTTS